MKWRSPLGCKYHQTANPAIAVPVVCLKRPWLLSSFPPLDCLNPGCKTFGSQNFRIVRKHCNSPGSLYIWSCFAYADGKRSPSSATSASFPSRSHHTRLPVFLLKQAIMQDEPLRTPTPDEPKEEKRSFLTQIPARVLLSLIAVLLATGSATAWWTWQTITTNRVSPPPTDSEIITAPIEPAPPIESEAPVTPQEPVAQSPATVPNATETAVQVFWLQDTGTNLELVPVDIRMDEEMSDSEQLTLVFEQLIQGPADSDMGSSIPEDTELNSLEIREDGVHVDLSDEFEFGGGSASMMGRLGQVIYTATTLDPAGSVWISVDGDPLKLLGGEGLIVDQPMTREEFEENYPL